MLVSGVSRSQGESLMENLRDIYGDPNVSLEEE